MKKQKHFFFMISFLLKRDIFIVSFSDHIVEKVLTADVIIVKQEISNSCFIMACFCFVAKPEQ